MFTKAPEGLGWVESGPKRFHLRQVNSFRVVKMVTSAEIMGKWMEMVLEPRKTRTCTKDGNVFLFAGELLDRLQHHLVVESWGVSTTLNGQKKRAKPSQVPSHVASCAEFGLIWKVDSWKCEVAQNECFFSWSQWSFPEHLAHHCAFGLGCHHCSRRLPWDQVPLGTWLCSSSGTRLTRYKPTWFTRWPKYAYSV